MSKSEIFLVMDCNRPGSVYAVDQDNYNWMCFNGCNPCRISVETAQELLTKGKKGWADFGEGEDQRWHYRPYEPLSENRLKEMRRWEKEYTERKRKEELRETYPTLEDYDLENLDHSCG